MVYGGYFVHVLAVYLQCTSLVHHPLSPVNRLGGRYSVVFSGGIVHGGGGDKIKIKIKMVARVVTKAEQG